MGYYTKFKGKVSGDGVSMAKFENDAEKEITFGSYDFPLSDFNNKYGFGDGETYKWYGYDSDMLGLSDKYRNLLFELTGEGEESGDLWKSWYRNGKSVRAEAQIVFVEPDLDTLLPLDLDYEKKAREQAFADALAAVERAEAEYEKAKALVDSLQPQE